MKLRNIIQSRATLGVLASLVIATATIAGAMAWGPERPTFTLKKPATYVTFNSMTDNPVVGDERNFVAVKDAANMKAGGFLDTIKAEEGKEYLVRVYAHNNAAANLNLVAKNTNVMAAIGKNTGNKVSITGYVSADNAKPQQVYDDVHFTSDKTFNLAYVPGSAMLYNNVSGKAGRAVSDSIVNGSGAKIGYEKNDGNVPGCFQYASYVTFKVKPQFAKKADFTVQKDVRKNGEKDWNQSIKAKAGDKVQYRVLFKNTSSVQLDNVMVRDTLPAGVTYTPGSTKLYLASDPKNARQMPDGITTKTGLNIGSYGKNGMASVIFDATIDGNDKLAVCGPNTLKNIAKVETDYGDKSDDAIVKVSKECEKPEETVERCDVETGKIVNDIPLSEANDKKYTTDYSQCEDKPVTPETPETPQTPEETPAELPETGMTNSLVGIFGVGALSYATYVYVTSRRM